MEEKFNINNYVDKDETLTMHSLQMKLLNRINEIADSTGSEKIITNGNLGHSLRGIGGYSNEYISNEIKKDIKSPFPVGQIGKLTVFVDPYMKWDDNRIIFYNESKDLFTLKVEDGRGILV